MFRRIKRRRRIRKDLEHVKEKLEVARLGMEKSRNCADHDDFKEWADLYKIYLEEQIELESKL